MSALRSARAAAPPPVELPPAAEFPALAAVEARITNLERVHQHAAREVELIEESLAASRPARSGLSPGAIRLLEGTGDAGPTYSEDDRQRAKAALRDAEQALDALRGEPRSFARREADAFAAKIVRPRYDAAVLGLVAALANLRQAGAAIEAIRRDIEAQGYGSGELPVVDLPRDWMETEGDCRWRRLLHQAEAITGQAFDLAGRPQ